jgi:tRNA G10  N-methylase Trm11
MLGCKKKRVVLRIQQKLEIINQLEKRGVVEQVAMQYGIGEQTVRDLKNQKNQLIFFASSSNSKY